MEAKLRRCSLRVDPLLPTSKRDSQVRDVCRALVDEWIHLGDDMLVVTEISGGITNTLLKVHVRTDPEQAVTVRVFGRGTDVIIDRSRELQMLPHLSAAGFGAKLIGLYADGMVQSFIKARTLETEDLRNPKIAALIAEELRRFHDTGVPKEPQLWNDSEPQLWNDLWKFFKQAKAVSFSDDEKKQKQLEKISFNNIEKEIKALKVLSDSLKAPIVFSHNDLLAGNIMLDDESGKIHFIDFEYSSFSYRGFDIGNHFNEHAGLRCDYSLYPSKDEQYHFFSHYLHPGDATKAAKDELEDLYLEANFYALASHLYWGIWGIIQAKISTIDFDYLAYYFDRMNEYNKQKDEVVSLVAAKLCREP